PASVTSTTATSMSTSAVPAPSPTTVSGASNAAGAKSIVPPANPKAAVDRTVSAGQATTSTAASKQASGTVAKPGADEVIDAILSDMQRQQAGSPPATAGDQ
ncbi:MAG TPA: hypothetical protein VF920_16035, partial [Dongiaceae bacterium]